MCFIIVCISAQSVQKHMELGGTLERLLEHLPGS